DSLAHHRTHGGGKESEIHHRNPDLVTINQRVTAQDRVNQAGAVLIFAQPILVTGHALKLERVDRSEFGVELDETVRIAKIRHSVLGREWEMVFAARANALVLIQLDFVHHLTATGTFLPQALGHVALSLVISSQSWFFENCHLEISRVRR